VPGTTELAPDLPCLPHDTYACGAFQLLGEYGVAGWGWNISGDELVTEFKLDDASDITFQLRSGYSKEGAYATYRVVKCLSAAPVLAFTQQAASWSEIEYSSGYVLSVAHQGADAVLSVEYTGNACDIYNLPAGEYVAKVTENDFGVSSAESSLTVESNDSPAAVVSTENGIDDLFFAKANTTWEIGYFARHVGSVNDWTGTNDLISPYGKNRIADLFSGSNDANILELVFAAAVATERDRVPDVGFEVAVVHGDGDHDFLNPGPRGRLSSALMRTTLLWEQGDFSSTKA